MSLRFALTNNKLALNSPTLVAQRAHEGWEEIRDRADAVKHVVRDEEHLVGASVALQQHQIGQ